jgi:hypothetical protein
LTDICNVLSVAVGKNNSAAITAVDAAMIPKELLRGDEFMTHPVFNTL